ncbi:nucleotide exchange factor GrpE [Streptomyces sp. NBC_00249]|uniref:nucleotide exchange factor GrpE n=1 Tax=Streptomyces sp. NBC_00249 TaxID=2975690 RepID=UPI00225B5975|nr:nucleotide exchange factor GrpE [Streptomyces sp. NBC_00249]MCX5199155.1 nucleotide exchange factor GrpE [Streptomyces sp. NBC_00249]
MNRPNTYGPSEPHPSLVIHDRRRIDPETLQLREPDQIGPEREGGEHVLGTVDRASTLEAELADRTAELQRVEAAYENYRERVQHDRAALREIHTAKILDSLLPVLDGIDRARGLGEVAGELRVAVDTLEDRLSDLGLERVGAPGEPFDPLRHEAVDHQVWDEVEVPVCGAVLRPGYRVGTRLLRPAQVSVTEPPDSLPATAAPES